MKQRIITLLHSKGLQQSLYVSGANAGATVISALALIIFSRTLGPSDFGVLSTALSLQILTLKCLDFGFNIATQRYIAKKPADYHRIIRSGLTIKLILGSALFVLAWVVGPVITRFLAIESPLLISVSLALTGVTLLFDYLGSVLMGLRAFATVVGANVTHALTKLASAGFLIVTGWINPFTAFLGYALSPIAAIVLIAPQFYKKGLAGSFSFDFHVKPIVNVAKFMGLWVLAAAVAEHFDILMINNLLTNSETGLYAAAQKVAMLPTFMGFTITTVLSVRVAQYHHPSDLRSYLKKATIFSVVIMCGTLILLPVSGYAILLTAGKAYLAATPSLMLLLVGSALFTALAPFDALFYLFNQPQFYAYKGLLLIISLMLLDIVLIPRYGLIGAGYAQVIMRTIVALYTLSYARRAYRAYIKSLQVA